MQRTRKQVPSSPQVSGHLLLRLLASRTCRDHCDQAGYLLWRWEETKTAGRGQERGSQRGVVLSEP